MNETIIQNLNKAIEVVTNFPAEQLDLTNFRVDTECGTLYCTLGLLTTVEYFQNLGLSFMLTPLKKIRGCCAWRAPHRTYWFKKS